MLLLKLLSLKTQLGLTCICKSRKPCTWALFAVSSDISYHINLAQLSDMKS